MGGRGSGGARVGAGRKRKDPALKVFHGTATLDERKRLAKGAGAADKALPVEHVHPPEGMPPDQLEVWKQLAPHALLNRTLTASTAVAFAYLCQSIAIERDLMKQIQLEGYTFNKTFLDKDGNVLSEEPKIHPLVAQHRAWKQRVEVGMKDFMLAPFGKELVSEDKPEDPFAAFDDHTAAH